MTNGDGQDKVEEVKHCPFRDTHCIRRKCAIYSELIRTRTGQQEKFWDCAFNAIVLILSEINAKTQFPQQQKIQIPKVLFKQ